MKAREHLALAAPATPKQPSNVVTLRPGFVLPVPAPDLICAPDTTKEQIRSVSTSALQAKKRLEINDTGPVVSCREDIAHHDVSSTRANAELSKAEFAALVRRLSAMELIQRFPLDYSSWKDMKGRRRNGCEIAPEFHVFRSFLRHMGVPRPAASWTLDRINPFRKEYGPGLCRWAPRDVQDNNRTDTIRLTGADGRTLPLTEWATLTKQDPKTLRQRRARHPDWTDAEIIGGGVIEAEPAPAAPAPARAAARAPAGESWRDRWPPGVTPERWEGPYEAFRAKHGHRFGRHLRRSVFFSWVAGGWLRPSVAHLERQFPNFRTGEWDDDPDYEADPHKARFDLLEQPVMVASLAMDDAGRGTLDLLREACPAPEDQNATLRVKFPDLESDRF